MGVKPKKKVRRIIGFYTDRKGRVRPITRSIGIRRPRIFRSAHALAVDRALKARRAKSAEEWMKNPNRLDLPGVDMGKKTWKRKGRKAKSLNRGKSKRVVKKERKKEKKMEMKLEWADIQHQKEKVRAAERNFQYAMRELSEDKKRGKPSTAKEFRIREDEKRVAYLKRELQREKEELARCIKYQPKVKIKKVSPKKYEFSFKNIGNLEEFLDEPPRLNSQRLVVEYVDFVRNKVIATTTTKPKRPKWLGKKLEL